MKYNVKITLLLLGMFLITQLFGIFVVNQYTPTVVFDSDGNPTNITTHNLPYGMEPPEDIEPQSTLIAIIIAIAIAVTIMFVLMKYNAEIVLRAWFFVVVTLAIGITLNAVFLKLPSSSVIAILIALPLAFFKIFKRNIVVHNLTELIIYPGIASIFVPILSLWTAVILLVAISLYDMYAVWHAGFMQKMAQYQIQTLKVFSGFFVPHVGRKEKELIKKAAKAKTKKGKEKEIKVSVAILGGGDVVFPIILAGTALMTLGLTQAILIAVGATLALAGLFYLSKKGHFYPAMPFISAGCLIALGIGLLI